MNTTNFFLTHPMAARRRMWLRRDDRGGAPASRRRQPPRWRTCEQGTTRQQEVVDWPRDQW